MNTPLPEKLEYTARFGTVFISDPKLDNIVISKNKDIFNSDETYLVRDCMEFAAWHAIHIHPRLDSFQGYDTIFVDII
jgi:hypothetical protein